MKRALSLLLVAAFLVGCNGQTDPATNVTSTSALLHGRVGCADWEIGTMWWRYRTDTGPWVETNHVPYDCPEEGAANLPVVFQLSGLTPGTHYRFGICAQPSDTPLCANANGQLDLDPDNPREPLDAFDTLPVPTNLRPVDGGADYYAQFNFPLPSDPSYFPLGVWGSYDQTQANIDKDKAVGLNLYVWPADTSIPLSRFEANGMHLLLTDDWYGVSGVISSPANNGYMLADEVDMTQGPNGGYETMTALAAAAPDDGRAHYANYGKGVAFWETDQQAQRFVNEFQQLQSDDIYWFTDPNLDSPAEGPYFLNSIGRSYDLRRAANYGYIVDRMRYLDNLDGQRKPIWNFVEVGWPFTESASQGGRTIAPAEIRAAVWHSIIAGARGIVYFNHSFGGPCTTHHVLRDPCYAAVQATVTAVNAQINQLAPVLNAPFEDDFATASNSVRLMSKNLNGQHYVFAGSRENVASDPTFTVASGTTVIVLGEGRSLPITNGQFTDHFADGNAIHIYEVR